MNIYGNNILKYNYITTENFFDILEESENNIEKIFDSFSIIKENDDTLSLVDKKSEEAKKTLIQKIKELVNKFVQFCKDLFKKVSEKIKQIYLNTNFVDEFVSKFKDKMTFQNMLKAKENGWKGIPNHIPMINHVANLSDSKLAKAIEEDYGLYTVVTLDDIDPIIKAKDLEDAKDKYNEFETKLKKFKSEIDVEDSESYLFSNNGAKFDILGTKIGQAYFVISKDISEDGNHYYPTIIDCFQKTKIFAEEGEKNIKKIAYEYKKYVNEFIVSKQVTNSNIKSYNNGGSNHTGDNETDNINILYYKAIYKYQSAVMQRTAKITKAVLGVLKEQHSTSIKFYMHCVQGIKKYALN